LRASSPIEERIIAAIEPAASERGFRLVRVRLSGNRRKRLQVMAERADGTMPLEGCATLSRAISAVLDEQDPIDGEYDLEVSSPGIDRPLVSLEDFDRFVGHEAKLETSVMIDGRRRFRGTIAGRDGGAVKLTLPEGELVVAFASLADARLVLTDRLIEEDLKRAKAAEAAERAIPPPLAGEVPSEARGRGQTPSPLSHAARDSSPARGGAKEPKRKTK
jgi:ribosome maturation factor RimP